MLFAILWAPAAARELSITDYGAVPGRADNATAAFENGKALYDAMLAARADERKDVVITILGPTSGTRAIVMDQFMGEAFVLNLLRTLKVSRRPYTARLRPAPHALSAWAC